MACALIRVYYSYPDDGSVPSLLALTRSESEYGDVKNMLEFFLKKQNGHRGSDNPTCDAMTASRRLSLC